MIPLCDLGRQYQTLQAEIDRVLQDVASRGRYILGPNVSAFESELAEYCEADFAVGVGSGTDALHLAMLALDIGSGDEVITTPFTFVATTEAIGIVGAKPVFVDIDPRTHNLDPRKIEAAITPRTKAILPVHLYGQPCDMAAILDIAHGAGLAVVEDCAQAIGAVCDGKRVGGLGDLGCFSFFPSKNLGAMGDGGSVVTSNPKLAERVRLLRQHGGRVKYHHEVLGLNSRLDEIQAAILRLKLPHLDRWNHLRRKVAYSYNTRLQSTDGLQCPMERRSQGYASPQTDISDQQLTAVYHQYTVMAEEREGIKRELSQQDIGCAVYYPIPLHLQQVHAELGHRAGDFPNAEDSARRCLSLPIFPEIRDDELEQVVAALKSVRRPQTPQIKR